MDRRLSTHRAVVTNEGALGAITPPDARLANLSHLWSMRIAWKNRYLVLTLRPTFLPSDASTMASPRTAPIAARRPTVGLIVRSGVTPSRMFPADGLCRIIRAVPLTAKSGSLSGIEGDNCASQDQGRDDCFGHLSRSTNRNDGAS
jgi:hypothetical protein